MVSYVTRVNRHDGKRPKVLRILIIAGAAKQVHAYCYRKFISPSVSRTIHDPRDMYGHNEGTLVICIGDYKQRKDLEELKALADRYKYIWTEDLT